MSKKRKHSKPTGVNRDRTIPISKIKSKFLADVRMPAEAEQRAAQNFVVRLHAARKLRAMAELAQAMETASVKLAGLQKGNTSPT